MSTVLGLREFTHMRWAARVLIVDARERPDAAGEALDNPFFAWIRISSKAQAQRLAGHIAGRHLIIVHEDVERALDLDQTLKGLELHSSALEAGERGWREAVIEENVETFGDVVVVTMNQIAVNKRYYIFVRGPCAVAVQPCGSTAALREEIRHHGVELQAILRAHRHAPDAEALAALLRVPCVDAPFEIGGMRLDRLDDNTLQLRTGTGDSIRVS